MYESSGYHVPYRHGVHCKHRRLLHVREIVVAAVSATNPSLGDSRVRMVPSSVITYTTGCR